MNITETSRKILAAIKDSDLVGARPMVLDLESHPDLVNSMHFDGTFCWRGEGDQKTGPYCQSRIEL